MKKKKIAVLVDWYLPGTHAGGPVRSIHSLLNLLKQYYDFYVITRNTDLGSEKAYEGITSNHLFEKDAVSYYYFSNHALTSGNLLKLLAGIDPDLVYTNSFWSFPFSIQVVRASYAGKLTCPLLLAPRGMLGRGALGLKSVKKKLFLAAARITGWYNNITFHATQQQEKNDVLSIFPSANVLIAPNINATSPVKNKSVKLPGHLKLFFLSRISEVKNLHFALEVLKAVPGEINITYDIYGNTEDKDYWELCSNIIAELPHNVKVQLKGEIPFDKVPEVIKHYNALFLTTLNENFGHSIVESLLCGCPVIISDQTPWNDVQQYNAGYALQLGNTAAYLQALVTLAKEDAQQFETRSDAANNYISKKIDLQGIVQLYKTLFDGTARH